MNLKFDLNNKLFLILNFYQKKQIRKRMTYSLYRDVIASCHKYPRSVDGISRKFKIPEATAQAYLNQGVGTGWLKKTGSFYRCTGAFNQSFNYR